MTGNLIVTTPRAEFRPLAFKGITAYTSYPQIRDMLSRNFDKNLKLDELFARPAENTRNGEIDWYTNLQGDPKKLTSLPEEQQHAILESLRSKAQEIDRYADRLISTGEPLKVTRGNILKLALMYPDESSIYVIDNQPVLTCWGFGPGAAGVEAKDLAKHAWLLHPKEAAPQEPEPDAVPQTAPAASHVQEEVENREKPVYAAAPAKRTILYSLWWWLLPLLALLLLLLLLFSSFGPFMPVTGISLLKFPWPAVADDSDLKLKLPRLEQDINDLNALLDQHLAMCVPEKKTPPAPKEPEKLVIPEDAADMDFLTGRWLCETGLVNSRTGEPVQVTFEFGSSGKGQATVIQRSGPCSGPAAAELVKGRLNIKLDELVCNPPTASYARMNIFCENAADKSTICKGQNSDGSTWDALFHKIR